VLNPDQHVATNRSGGSLRMEVDREARQRIRHADANRDEEAAVGTIAMDAVYSPIRSDFTVTSARVGQRTTTTSSRSKCGRTAACVRMMQWRLPRESSRTKSRS